MGSETRRRGLNDGLVVEHDARPVACDAPRVAQGGMEMRLLACNESRMFRSLHGRWPYRRSHCRHDLHWLVRVQSRACASSRDRTHSLSGLRACNRRPQQR